MAIGNNSEGELPKAGWYPDAANPGRERLWTGERWVDWIRPVKAGRVEATPVGWYPDTGHPGFERLWSGEMWTEEIRRADAVGAAPVQPPVGVGAVAQGGGPQSFQPQPFQPHPQQMPLQPLPRATVSYHDDNPPNRLGGLGTWVTIALGAAIVSTLAQLVANQRYIAANDAVINETFTALTNVHSKSNASNVTHLITLIVEVVTAVLFVVWFYRAYRNLIRAGISDLRFGPGWAVGGWFIPIYSLIRQKQIANDIWKASSSAATVGVARWREMPLANVVNWWWGVWIAAGLLVGFGMSRVRHGYTTTIHSSVSQTVVYTNFSPSDLQTRLWITQVGLVFLIAAAILAILYVREVSRLQDGHFEARVPGSP